MDKERRVLLDNRQGRQSQQLRAAQSVCDQPSNPPYSLPPSVPPHYCPASIPAPSEGWGRECRAKLAFVPFMKTTNGLYGLDQQGCGPETCSNNIGRRKTPSLWTPSLGGEGEDGHVNNLFELKYAAKQSRHKSMTGSNGSFCEVASSLNLETNFSCQLWGFKQYQLLDALRIRYTCYSWSQMAEIIYYSVI